MTGKQVIQIDKSETFLEVNKKPESLIASINFNYFLVIIWLRPFFIFLLLQ